MTVDVCVVGSINQDLLLRVDRTPRPGETVLGGDVVWAPGGKGANQAVACARLGVTTAMVGAVGDDASGLALRQRLRDEDVDVRHVTTSTSPTGLAAVLIDTAGESTIVVSPGANGCLTPEDVEVAADAVSGARIVLCQLEVPLPAIERALALATGTVVCNPAPGRPLPASLLERVDVLVPNRHELAILTNSAASAGGGASGRGGAASAGGATSAGGAGGGDEVARLAHLAGLVRGPSAVVVTLGADGALVVADGRVEHLPALAVTPVDATGAGDSFCGALCWGLVNGRSVAAAARDAVAIASLATRRIGAMDAQPVLVEAQSLLRSLRGV